MFVRGCIAGNRVFDDLIGYYWMFLGNNVVLFFCLFCFKV